ncbi:MULTISPECIES: helix-turn-helix domain-containing protein [Photobacterium]|uniref:XRE family transcriptional regulator n=1 Tax=Photobacterium pectinilyticum TaxID=2906793 RepID=A0ABT1N6K0_9GAMM|nr:XRE family transcriptional regulator [Photobacterium sp. ZSDE20]MCQ1059336.1 XRE family transcriptional regulator [Photobacterium sp. ZSDE20]MDD1825595.1 XRE family transcriptional regulator [Photobacterium sp. ZSDE20]
MGDFSALGEKLKATRNKMGLSLSDMSAKTGVSKTMLSQIERSESMPTIATVWKIANGLKIKLETLLDDSSQLYEVKSIDDKLAIKDDDGRMIIHSIFPFSPISGYEVFYGVFKPGCNYSDDNHTNSTTEQLFVTDGELEMIVGQNTYRITAGCSLSFDSSEKHRYINNGDIDANVLIIVNYE